MPIVGMTILLGGAVAATGGVSKTYSTDGKTVVNGVHLIDASVSDYRTRPNTTVKYKAPTLAADGSYSKEKMSMVAVRPFISADGKTHFNLARTEIEVHPETSVTEKENLRSLGAQNLTRPATDEFWKTGSMT